MRTSNSRADQPRIRTVIELHDKMNLVLPDDMTLFLVRWMEALTDNGFSNVRISSQHLRNEIRMEMEAGSILRGTLELHQAQALERFVQLNRAERGNN